MFDSILSTLAAAAAIATFLLEAWLAWKEYRPGRKRSDGDGNDANEK